MWREGAVGCRQLPAAVHNTAPRKSQSDGAQQHCPAPTHTDPHLQSATQRGAAQKIKGENGGGGRRWKIARPLSVQHFGKCPVPPSAPSPFSLGDARGRPSRRKPRGRPGEPPTLQRFHPPHPREAKLPVHPEPSGPAPAGPRPSPPHRTPRAAPRRLSPGRQQPPPRPTRVSGRPAAAAQGRRRAAASPRLAAPPGPAQRAAEQAPALPSPSPSHPRERVTYMAAGARGGGDGRAAAAAGEGAGEGEGRGERASGGRARRAGAERRPNWAHGSRRLLTIPGRRAAGRLLLPFSQSLGPWGSHGLPACLPRLSASLLPLAERRRLRLSPRSAAPRSRRAELPAAGAGLVPHALAHILRGAAAGSYRRRAASRPPRRAVGPPCSASLLPSARRLPGSGPRFGLPSLRGTDVPLPEPRVWVTLWLLLA